MAEERKKWTIEELQEYVGMLRDKCLREPTAKFKVGSRIICKNPMAGLVATQPCTVVSIAYTHMVESGERRYQYILQRDDGRLEAIPVCSEDNYECETMPEWYAGPAKPAEVKKLEEEEKKKWR